MKHIAGLGALQEQTVHPVRNLTRDYKESSPWPDAHSVIVKYIHTWMSNISLQVVNYCLYENDARAARTHFDPSDYHMPLFKVEFGSIFILCP